MIRAWFTAGCLVGLLTGITSTAMGAEPDELRTAAEKSIALLQKCGPEFFKQSGCVACHQQSVTSLALAEARSRGFRVDESTARAEVHVIVTALDSYRDRLLQRVDHPLNSADSTGFLLLGLAAEKAPANATIDSLVLEMANRQTPEGSWTTFGHRPPLEYSRIGSTALAIRVMQLYSLPGWQKAFDQRIQRGSQWLAEQQPSTNMDEAFRLLGLAWSGADQKLVESQKASLLAEQRQDGGWAPLANLESDAYATGVTLYALYQSGSLAPTDSAYLRGVDFLLKTQLSDGSWHVKSRSFPFQRYFESGFPHGADQWISACATGFAAAALCDAAPPLAGPSK